MTYPGWTWVPWVWWPSETDVKVVTGLWAFLPRPQILVSHFPDKEMVSIKDPSHDAGHGHPDVMAQGVVRKGYKVLGGHFTWGCLYLISKSNTFPLNLVTIYFNGSGDIYTLMSQSYSTLLSTSTPTFIPVGLSVLYWAILEPEAKGKVGNANPIFI